MKRAKRFAALALALALALSLAGCGAMEDVSRTLVQGNLDEIYLGKYSDEFLELVDITADEAEATICRGFRPRPNSSRTTSTSPTPRRS